MSRIEASDAASPKAPLRLVAALEGKLDDVTGQQVGWAARPVVWTWGAAGKWGDGGATHAFVVPLGVVAASEGKLMT